MNEINNAYEIIDINNTTNIHFEYSKVPSSFIAMHWHDALEIISVLDGELLVETEQKHFHLTAGHCILLNPNILHSTTSVTGNTSILVQIPLQYLEHYIPDIHERQFIWNPLTQNQKELTKIEYIKETLQQMLVLDDIRPDGYELRFQSLLFELFYQLYHNFSHKLSAASITHSEKQKERLRFIFQYTEKNYKNAITLDEIAKEMHLQTNYFCRFFKTQTGTTYLNYVNEYRISKIYQDLIVTDIPIKDLLEIHGFTNYKLFRTMFFNRFMQTPNQIRSSLQNQK